MKNFIVTFIYIQTGLVNDVLSRLLDFVYYAVEKLYTGEEVAHNTLVTVNQVIIKRQQDLQI